MNSSDGSETEGVVGAVEKRWYHATTRGYLLDFHMPDSADQGIIGQPVHLRNLDAGRVVAQLADAGVEALYAHAKDNQGNCYYDTSVGHKHTGIGERDLMAEFSRECRARGMRLLYYVQLSRERRSFEFGAHQARQEDGTPVLHANTTAGLPSRGERPVVCLNGPHREYILAIARELAANYDFDGFWFDCFGWWGRVECCYCDTCRVKYREDVGQELPSGPRSHTEEWRSYLRWRHRINALLWREITESVRSIKPGLSIAHNGGTQPWAEHGLYTYDDYVTSEFHYDAGHGNLSLQCRKLQALKPGVPFEKEIWRFFRRGSDMHRGYQVRPLPMHLVEMSAVVAHGGFVQYYDQINPDGSLDGRSLEVLTAAFDAVREREPWLGSADPIGYASVVWSLATEVYAQAEHAELHRTGLEGVHHALIEGHLPLGVLTDRQVARGEFGSNKVIVLPSVSCMSDEEADQLGRFVRQGGGLVVTHRSSLCDELGRPRGNFALSEVQGVDYVEPASYLYSFLQPEVEHPVTEGLTMGWPMTVWKMPQAKVRLRDASALGCLVNPMRGFHMGHPPMEVTSFPSIVVQEFGAGRVVYFAAPVDAVYGQYGHPDYRQLLENAVRWAAGGPPLVEVDGPLSLEVVARTDRESGRMVVHLLNRATVGGARAKGSVVQELIPVRDVVVRLGGGIPCTKASLQPGAKDLSITPLPGQDGAEIVVPQVDFHDMVVLDIPKLRTERDDEKV